LEPRRPLADARIAAVLQQPAQADQVKGIVLDAVIFRVLERVRVHTQ